MRKKNTGGVYFLELHKPDIVFTWKMFEVRIKG